ncbi:MAG: DNA cytosine methyltransferase, partial [Acidobacteriota bacterium]|nr:DNA cytosine methyltransferase [Acidobacteriota bacterium]
MRVLELFSGLGGWRLALGNRGVVAAYDVNESANATYALNHGEAPKVRELATISLRELAAHGADTWLLSPPCQPFCRMGNHGGLDDRRSRAFRHLMELFPELAPERLVLENVGGFLGSDAHALLAAHLRAHGLHRLDLEACPSRFGLPNQRPRVYVVASRKPMKALPLPDLPPRRVAEFLDAV